MRMATGSLLIRSASLEKTQSPLLRLKSSIPCSFSLHWTGVCWKATPLKIIKGEQIYIWNVNRAWFYSPFSLSLTFVREKGGGGWKADFSCKADFCRVVSVVDTSVPQKRHPLFFGSCLLLLRVESRPFLRSFSRFVRFTFGLGTLLRSGHVCFSINSLFPAANLYVRMRQMVYPFHGLHPSSRSSHADRYMQTLLSLSRHLACGCTIICFKMVKFNCHTSYRLMEIVTTWDDQTQGRLPSS